MIFFYGVCFPSYPVSTLTHVRRSACDIMGDVLYLFNLFGCIFYRHTILVFYFRCALTKRNIPKGRQRNPVGEW